MDMQPCVPCHPQSRSDLRSAVIRIQDHVVGVILNAGYALAADATMFQLVNTKVDTTTPENKADYAEAKDAYIQAFYRSAFLGAENSVGFHNPIEANRIGADALAYSQRCAEILRKILARNGVSVPNEVQLNLLTYLYSRGTRKLMFDPALEFRDPSGVAEDLWRNSLKSLRSGQVPSGSSGSTSSPPSSPATPNPTSGGGGGGKGGTGMSGGTGGGGGGGGTGGGGGGGGTTGLKGSPGSGSVPPSPSVPGT
jgi:hypothetical protein